MLDVGAWYLLGHFLGLELSAYQVITISIHSEQSQKHSKKSHPWYIIILITRFGGIENLLFGQNREIRIYLFHLQMPRLCQVRQETFYLPASRNLWVSDKSDHQVYSRHSNNPGQTRFVLFLHTQFDWVHPGKVDVEGWLPVLFRDQRQTPLLTLPFDICQIGTIIKAMLSKKEKSLTA